MLPMKTHLAIDMASGGMLALSPLLLKKRERDVAKIATLVGLGLYEIAVAMLTQTRSPIEQAEEDFEIDVLSIDQLQPMAV